MMKTHFLFFQAASIRVAAILLVAVASAAPTVQHNSVPPAGSGTLTVSPAMLNFGQVKVGSASAPQTVTLTNTGSALVEWRSHDEEQGGIEEFSINGCPTPQLLPGASCTYTVVFYAKVVGAHHAYLLLVDNGTVNPIKVHLNGTGIQ